MCNLEVLRLKTFKEKDLITKKSSSLKKILNISIGISKIINLKKVELNIYLRNDS